MRNIVAGLALASSCLLDVAAAAPQLAIPAELHRELFERMQYDVTGASAGGGRGGEYPLQHGFGWTNGVLRKLLSARTGGH